MNLLLSSGSNTTVVAIIVILTIFVIAGLIVYGFKRDDLSKRKMITKHQPKSVNVEIKKQFMKPSEVVFLKTLCNVLPSEFVAFPRIGVSAVIQPKNDKILYNAITEEYCDVCVFYKTSMEPVLVIDLYESSPVEQQMKQLNPNVKKAFEAVKLPIISFQLSEEYDLVTLRTKVIEAMPAKMIALLKDKVKNEK